MTATELSARLIRVFEGCRLAAYQDTGGIWTIGFGHTKGVKSGDVITFDQAENFLEEDLSDSIKLTQGRPLLETAALLSFKYNCGVGALQNVLNGKAQLENFIRDRKGNVLPGLVSRRSLESALIGLGSLSSER